MLTVSTKCVVNQNKELKKVKLSQNVVTNHEQHMYISQTFIKLVYHSAIIKFSSWFVIEQNQK